MMYSTTNKGITEKDFKEIYSKFYERLYAFINSRVNQKEVVSELSFDTFLKLWNQLKQGKELDNIEAYLFSIAKNVIYDHYQSLSKKKGKQVFLDIIPDVENTAKNPEQSLLNDELKSILEKSIQTLSPQSEKIFRMIRIDGLKYSEVAEKLNISVNSVDTQLSRAIKKLRTSLKSYKEDKASISKKLAEGLSILLPLEIFFDFFFKSLS